jgi:hypothetical protein
MPSQRSNIDTAVQPQFKKKIKIHRAILSVDSQAGPFFSEPLKNLKLFANTNNNKNTLTL